MKLGQDETGTVYTDTGVIPADVAAQNATFNADASGTLPSASSTTTATSSFDWSSLIQPFASLVTTAGNVAVAKQNATAQIAVAKAKTPVIYSTPSGQLISSSSGILGTSNDTMVYVGIAAIALLGYFLLSGSRNNG